MISFHRNTRDIEFHPLYCVFESAEDGGDPSFIGRCIKKCVNSPIVWHDGRRKQANFKSAEWLVLDIDDGMSLEDAVKEFKGYTHVIGTTRHHRLPKGEKRIVRDRFRVWLKLNGRCDKLEDYTATVKFYVAKYGGDDQAVDGARKFLPCNEIVSMGTGTLLDVKRFVPQPVRPRPSFKPLPHQYIPMFIAHLLETGGPDGARNHSCFKVGRYLGSNGFTEGEIVDMVVNSAIPSPKATLGEIRSAVRNGIARSRSTK